MAGVWVSLAGIAKSHRSFKDQDPKVRALLSQMTLEEKVGQMVQANSASLKDPSDVAHG